MYGGRSYIGFRTDICEAAGLQCGKAITLSIEPDTASARQRFEALSYSHQREHATWVAEAKKPETRERRIARVIDMLKTDR